MLKNQPLITIGITAFNAANSIENAINSALSQKWRPIEIIVVDDCSTDGTATSLERLENIHPELKIYTNDVNSGVAVSRNRIISEAKGEFVAFFDDDDESAPERLDRQYIRIIEYEKKFAKGAPVICHTARRVLYTNGLEHTEPTMGQNEGNRAPSGIAVAKRILIGTPLKEGYGACPTCSQMARLTTYKLLNGFDQYLRRSEDTDLNIRLAKIGGHFVGIKEPLVTQYMTATSDKNLTDEFKCHIYLIDKHADIVGSNQQLAFCKAWLDLKKSWLEKHYTKFAFSLISLASRHPIQTTQRLTTAMSTIAINRAYSDFHSHK